jgi:hypothetical protein
MENLEKVERKVLKRVLYTESSIEFGISLIESGFSLRNASEKCGVPFKSLQRHYKKALEGKSLKIPKRVVKKLNGEKVRDNWPSRKTAYRFIKNSKSLSIRQGQWLEPSHCAVNSEDISNVLIRLNNTLVEKGWEKVWKHPENIFNTDETYVPFVMSK